MGKKVRCKRDFGYFGKGKIYYVQRMVTIHECGVIDSVWDIFFGEKPIGGARNILGSDLQDFFEEIQ